MDLSFKTEVDAQFPVHGAQFFVQIGWVGQRGILFFGQDRQDWQDVFSCPSKSGEELRQTG